MKRIIIGMIMMCAAVASGATSAQEGASAVQSPQASAAGAWGGKLSVEVGAVGHFAMKDMYRVEPGDGDSLKVNMYGGDVAMVLQLEEKHKIIFRLGYMQGTGSLNELWEIEGIDCKLQERWNMNTVYFMPGYRYESHVDKGLSVYVGAFAGIAIEEAECKERIDTKEYNVNVINETLSMKDTGFAVAVEAGVKYKISERASVYAGMSLMRVMATPTNNYWEVEVQKQTYAGVRFGINMAY